MVNSILGTKLSIVTRKPQTTRKRVLGIYSSDTAQMILIDTPGIIKPKYELQRAMMQQIEGSIGESDVIVIIVDSIKYNEEKIILPEHFISSLKNTGKKLILLLNKIDLLKNKKEILPLMSHFYEQKIYDEIIPISALKKDNIDEVLKVIEKYLPVSPFYYDPELISTQNERFFVSELIRERIFELFEEEIPYSTEVIIQEFIEREQGKWYIAADIIIERQSQKGIIIGAKGSMLKKIGALSRAEIEEHLDMPVFLELFVKVREKWRNDKTQLRSFGY